MQLIPKIGKELHLKNGTVVLENEYFTYCPHLKSHIFGIFTDKSRFFKINIYLENIDNMLPEIIYPQYPNVINIYDYDISHIVDKFYQNKIDSQSAYKKIKRKIQDIIEEKLICD